MDLRLLGVYAVLLGKGQPHRSILGGPCPSVGSFLPCKRNIALNRRRLKEY